MSWSWFPWKFLVRRLARAHGFLDPFAVLGQLERFAQVSEVSVPVELLRAGVAFHARGLMNTKAIQHNLDWVWPYWVRRQFDPNDPAFLPRAFSITHVNLTHRNWTAVGLPGCAAYPLVDPRGLLTPYFDGWSLDAWILPDAGEPFLPARRNEAEQTLGLNDETLQVRTVLADDTRRLAMTADVVLQEDRPVCRWRCEATSHTRGWLVLAVRPFNPEGVSVIRQIAYEHDTQRWQINKQPAVHLAPAPERHLVSTYRTGDVYQDLLTRENAETVTCDVGLATAAALYRLEPDVPRKTMVTIDLTQDKETKTTVPVGIRRWSEALEGAALLDCPDAHASRLYAQALQTLTLLTPDKTYPGPYTYKRFWIRDAAFLVHALLAANLEATARPVVASLPAHQDALGYFRSQEGEWDANGEALWTLGRYTALTGRDPDPAWKKAVVAGGRWIARKRCDKTGDTPHAGLLPPGFSAEHLGNNDYYYWDDFWSVAGLREAAALCDRWGETKTAHDFRDEANDLLCAIHRSIDGTAAFRNTGAVPASPYRRMDAGAVGSLAAGYPLQLWNGTDARLTATAETLVRDCFHDGAFFQDMIHSGLNAYLTLHVAQVLLRAGDGRGFDLMDRVAQLASPTGQWPEAIHPQTGGGCMGDGQHGWAAAEWVLMIRNAFVREEADRLCLAAAIPPAWLDDGMALRLGPAPTPWGVVTVTVQPKAETVEIRWDADWRMPPPMLDAGPPGRATRIEQPDAHGSATINRAHMERAAWEGLA